MTDPVILLGTQSNGETLPVQVDDFGRLVAEGLQGSEGPEGPEGPQGPQGPEGPPGDLNLPPDPYEGALLGWLNGELSWVGIPPVPIPPGVFGPITAWDAQSGLLTVQGEIPAAVGSGVYVWQCNEDGTYFTEGWNTSQVWSNGIDENGVPLNPDTGGANTSFSGLFDGDLSKGPSPTVQNVPFSATFNPPLPGTVEFYNQDAPAIAKWSTDGVNYNNTLAGWNSVGTNVSELYFQLQGNANARPATGIREDGKILVDDYLSLNFRVNQVLGQSLLGIPSATVDFTIGKYLRVPEQRVAPWVLYGNDPTSLIDHLRSS